MFSIKSVLNIGKLIPVLDSRNSLQTLKSTGAQARPSNAAPNPNASQGSSVTPQHVQSVAARVEKTSDVSSKVTVTFQRNPNDYFFVDARVFVSGYKGNPAPVQVASGQSPISFSLENTGEPMTVTVQASGSLGQAALSTAPTTTLKVVKTSLATTPTPGGTGPGGSVSLTMPVEFSVAGSPGTALVVTKATETANTIWAGPTSGAAAQPTFRKLAAADIPFKNIHGWNSFCRVGHPSGVSGVFGCNPSNANGASLGGQSLDVIATATETPAQKVRTGISVGSDGIAYIADNIGEGGDGISVLTLGTLVRWQARIQLLESTSLRCWLGLFGSQTPGDLFSDTPNKNFVGFRFSTVSGDTHWQCITQTSSGSQTVNSSGVSLDIAASHKFSITFDGTNAVFFIDDAQVGSQNGTIPATSVGMEPIMYLDNTNNAANRNLLGYYSFWENLT